MTKIKIKPYNILIFIVLLLSVFPTLDIGTFEIPALYLLLPIGIIILLLIILGQIKIAKIFKYIIILGTLIIVEVYISTINGTMTALNTFIFPKDVIQYIVRFIYLITFSVIFYKGKVKADTFIKYFLIFLNIGMLIGILQWIPWSGREFFIKLYPFRDGTEQLLQLNRPLHLLRLHGFAQHATANGGLATFFFIYGCSVYKYHNKHKFLSILLMVISIINIFASQARAGILALVFSIFLFYFVGAYISKKKLKLTTYMILTFFTIIIVVQQLYNMGNPYINLMVYRWIKLIEQQGGGRVDQIKYFLSLLDNNIIYYLVGLSKQVINKSAISYGVEIEPINIFVTYGIIGFILQYSLILILLIYFFENIKIFRFNKALLTLLVSSFIGLFSYQIFSIAYYFFREIRVGLFPWILMGVAIGVCENCKLNGGLSK